MQMRKMLEPECGCDDWLLQQLVLTPNAILSGFIIPKFYRMV